MAEQLVEAVCFFFENFIKNGAKVPEHKSRFLSKKKHFFHTPNYSISLQITVSKTTDSLPCLQ
jgi:hypothetical protein